MEELTKTSILSLLSQVDRKGMDNVISYLLHSDYFTAHCHHHHRFKGGLAEHSLGVYWAMRAFAPYLLDESCRIVALFHDLCTTHHKDYDAIGNHRHGQRSVDLLDVLEFELHEDERLAISRHMHHVPSSELNAGTMLWHFLHLCDSRSAQAKVNDCKLDGLEK